jgi:hypothetical protein
MSFYEGKQSLILELVGTFGTTTIQREGEKTYLYVRDWKNTHSSMVFSLVPVLINFPEDVHGIAFLK